jgi:prepilin-type N-terminal cleavage/methylation domain-containing protein
MALTAVAARRRRGFTLVELLIVLIIGSVLMIIGMPALLNVAQKYRVHSSADTVMMLGREARYQAIERSTQVSVVPDTSRNMFYVIAASPPPTLPASTNFPNGYTDFPVNERVTTWTVPTGVTFTAANMITYNADGSGTGGPVVFSSRNQPSYTVTMSSTATGKLVVTPPT